MKKALDNPSLGIKVIDVREADEYEIAKVDGVPLLPLSQLNERFTELDPNQQYYLHCKAGVRSLKALNFLRQQGFKYLKSVKGGITAWSEEIDLQSAAVLTVAATILGCCRGWHLCHPEHAPEFIATCENSGGFVFA